MSKQKAAKAPQGRPTALTGGRRVNTYLDGSSIEEAARLGKGNVSEGIRLALKERAAAKFGK